METKRTAQIESIEFRGDIPYVDPEIKSIHKVTMTKMENHLDNISIGIECVNV